MAHKPCSGLFIISRNSIFLHPAQYHIQYLPVFFHAKITVPVIDNIVSTSRIKSGDQIPFFICSHRKLCLVAVPERLFHTEDRLHGNLFKSSDPPQIVLDLFLFETQLLLIIHHLQLASSAGTCHRTDRLHPMGRRFENPHQPRIGIIFLYFHDLCFDDISDHCILHKEGIAICFAYTLSIVSHIFDCHRQNIILLVIHHISPVFRMFDSKNRL